MLVISKPSRWKERKEDEGGHEDTEGQWVDEEVGSYRRVNGNG
jgi:hypothetical protein